MVLEYHKKWNKYTIGNIKWVNERASHPCRVEFIRFVEDNFPQGSVLEVGGGELIEARELTERQPELTYTVADISNVFLKNCRRFLKINCVKADMIDLPFKDKEFDLIYVTSVIEHTPDLRKMLDEFSRVSRHFHIVMFKWHMISGGLQPEYRRKKQYFSTAFNLPQLFKLISVYGDISRQVVSLKDGGIEGFGHYEAHTIKKNDYWRNGDRLIIEGQWK